LFLITGEAGLALGALLWIYMGDREAAVELPQWGWLIAALLLFTGLAISTWLTYQAFQSSTWLEIMEARFEQLSGCQEVLAWLSGVFFMAVLLSTAALAPLSLDPTPEMIVQFQATLLPFLPLFVWLGLAAGQLMAVILVLFPPARRSVAKALLLGGLLFLFVILYWQGAVQQLVKVNDDPELIDQGAYMNFTRRLFESGYTDLGGFNRMPAFPFIQSLLYQPGMGDEELFLQGKYLNLLLSLILLAGFGWFFFHHFRTLLALNLLLILAFLIFIFKAGFYQAELLFYFLNFFLFWCLWRLLQEPSWKLAGLAGLLAGMAHLTKASILPGLVLFLIFCLFQGMWVALRHLRSAEQQPSGQPIRMYFLVAPLVVLIFLASVFPYIQTAKRITGHYFYNVNSTFYLWYDSWEDAKLGTRAHGDREGWPDMPAEDIPSMSKYLKDNNLQKIRNRFVNGLSVVLDQMMHSYGYFKYILTFTGLFFIMLIISWRRVLVWSTANLFLLLFLLTYFIGYLLLYSWYAPIASGNRLILAQVIPLIILLSYGIQGLLGDAKFHFKGKSINLLTSINLVIFLVLIVDILDVLTRRITEHYGGF
jgi:hypothetical protein